MNDRTILQLKADGEDRRWLAVAAMLIHESNQGLTDTLSFNQPGVIPQLETALADYRPHRIGKGSFGFDREVGD